MRRLALTVLLAVALPATLAASLGASDGAEHAYRVRAIFDNAAAAVPGEDVKIAGARVGVIESMDVTPDNRAAIVLRIEQPGFDPFRADASCTVRPQSLIGEKFVECAPGSAAEPALRKIPDGEKGEGQYLLPVERTSSPVDLDLVNDVLRRPYNERLSILLSELGTGLAGRGKDLNEVIDRANPALRETDRVLAILARQNDVLANLARDSDAVLEPLARQRERVSGFIREANATGEATAARRDDIERSIARLPRTLPQLRATLADLRGFSEETTPVVSDAGDAARDLRRFLRELGPFSTEALPALRSLGEAVDVGGPALDASRPLLTDLRGFAGELRPLATDLDDLTRSLDETGAIERAMDYIFFQVAAINGFDGVSHYLRAGLIVNTCSVYAIEPTPSCNANYTETEAVRASAARNQPLDPRLAQTRKLLEGASRRGNAAEKAKPITTPRPRSEDPRQARAREQALDRIRKGAEPPAPRNANERFLDYLFGSDG